MASQMTDFPYGASYYPLVYPEDGWERDLRLMAEAGFTLLRTNDVHGGWDRLEPQRGNIRFDVLERFYGLAGRYGMRILLSTGAAAPPLWLARQYPDVRLLSSRGERYPLGGTYHWYCIHHPGYRGEQERFLRALVAWAVRQPEHFGWQISNELGFPFLPTREAGRLDLHCYCDHCQARFRQWLQERYGSLEALTEAWTWSATTHVYNDWLDVTPPEMRPLSWSSVTRWMDWRLFWQDSFAAYARWQHDLIRQADSDHPTTANLINFHSNDRFGALVGIDHWKLAQAVDHIGYDWYPGLHQAARSIPRSIFLDHGRSVARSTGRDLWVPELESGPIGGWVLGPLHNTSSDDILRYIFECLGHDAKLILYMPWKEWDYQPIRWGAIVDLDSNPTPRTEASTIAGRYMRNNAPFLLSAHVPQGQVALLDSKANGILFTGLGDEETLFEAQRGAYQSFWEQGYTVDFISPEHLRATGASGYAAVCLPLVAALDAATAEALRSFTERGGLVVGSASCSMLDERGWYHHQLPMPGLREVFGLNVRSVERSDDIDVRFEGQGHAGYLQRETIEPDADTEILARFGDGHPAVTLHHYGAGYGLYLATQASAAYWACDSELLKAVSRAVLPRLGIGPRIAFDAAGLNKREVDLHLLVGERRATVLITKHIAQDVRGEIVLALGHPVTRVEAGVLEPDTLSFTQDDKVHIPFRMAAGQPVQAIDLHWA